MFVLLISRSSLKLGHLGSKTRSSGQNLLKMFGLMISRSGLKLGHVAKSAENFVNTLAVTFLKQ